MSNWKLGLMIGGLVVALGFHVWADFLTNPIEVRGASELTTEMAGSIGSSVSAIFLAAFGKTYEITSASFDMTRNLGAPLVLLFISTAIFAYVLYQLCVSIFRDENNSLTYVWKGFISLALMYILWLSAMKTFDILLLNLAISIPVVLFFAAIAWYVHAKGKDERRAA